MPRSVSSQAEALYAENGGGLSVDDFTTACRRYPAKKAKGVDGWSSKELYSLPVFVLQRLVAVLRRCQLAGRWLAGGVCGESDDTAAQAAVH